jgi:hypothetical protein
MKVWLINATKKRVIKEVRKILYDHPRYRADSENVVNKYSFEERPQRGVIVNSASADRVRLSADNYVGRLSSFVMLAPVENAPGTTLEWVRENFTVLESVSPKRDVFPSPPGVYNITIKSVPDEAHRTPGEFVVDPLLTETNEPLIRFQSAGDKEAQLSRGHIYPGSVRLWLDGRRGLVPGVDFIVDHDTGEITFLRDTPTGGFIYADYRYVMPQQGPFQYQREQVNLDAIPGAILAFGDRPQDCDKQCVQVTDERTDVAEIYGGKYEVAFELTVFSRDAEDREKLSDYITIKLLEIQNSLGFEGLELLDIAPGGESEEIYNAETDEYYYEMTLSLSLRVDWEVHVPLPVTVSRAETTSQVAEQEHGYLDGSYPLDLLRNADQLGVIGYNVAIGRDLTFERVR